MFKQEKHNNIKDVETLIGPSIKVKGNFHGQGNIVVEGNLEGSLKTKKNVLVGNNAVIIANINAENAQIGGKIQGNIKVKNSLKIFSSANIKGDIECRQLSVEKGAVLNGKCLMHEKEENPPTEKHKK